MNKEWTSSLLSSISRLLGRLFTLRLSKEHYGMIAVIVVSTYHVVIHMRVVEGWMAVAIVMGGVLGYLNAIFAIQIFEAQDETRWPAFWGLILSMVVSMYMQYSFYDNNVFLTPYRPVLGFNLSAFLSGSWAPLFEIILGSMYGVRMRVARGQNSVIDQVAREWKNKLDDLSNRYSTLLKEWQTGEDHNHDLRTELSSAQERINHLLTQMNDLKTERAVLNAQLNSGQVDHRKPAKQNDQKSERLTTTERRQKLTRMSSSGELSKYNNSSLAKALGVQRATLRNDLAELGISLNGKAPQ